MSGLLAAAVLVVPLALGNVIHVPPWPLAVDGEVIAFEGSATLRAKGARVEPLGTGLWRVVPEPDQRRVQLRAGEAAVEVAVEPSFGRIVIEATPASLVKGRDRSAELRITILNSAGRPDPGAAPPTMVCSAGTLGPLESVGPGRYTARYELPRTLHPEVAVLTAISPRCPTCATPRAVGAAVLSLAAAIDLPGNTEPYVQVMVTIGDQTFGPVTSNEKGDFKVPVVVPAGVRFGNGVSVDKLGNRISKTIDLHLPPVNQIACTAWPRTLPANGTATAQIWCVATDATGRRTPSAGLQLTSSRERVGRWERVGGGLFRAHYVAPRGGGGHSDRLRVSFPSAGPASWQEVVIELATGAPADLGYALEREPVPLAGRVAVQTWAVDERGDALPPPSGPAGATLGFVTSSRFVARADAGDWSQLAVLRSELPPSREAAFLWLRREGNEWLASARSVAMQPVVDLALRFGSGAFAVTDARGEARVLASSQSETVEADGGLRAAGWAGFGAPAPAIVSTRTFAVPLGPESPTDVRATVKNGLLRWRVLDRSGRLLPGRPVRLQAGSVRLGLMELEGDGGRCRVSGHGSVAVVDTQTGVAAVVKVP